MRGCNNKTFGLWWSCRSCTYSLANSEQILQHQSSLMLYNYSEQSKLTQFHWIGQIQHIRVFLIELVHRQIVVETTFTRVTKNTPTQ